MQLIVGLGNPGPAYERTRHNIGFRCLDRLALRHGLVFGPLRHGCRWAEGKVAAVDVVLLRPLRYMNRSGEALAAWAREEGRSLRRPFDPEGPLPLVVVDDIALPLGAARLRAKGSDGGHNGLVSLARALGTEAYPRLRLGVGADGEAVLAAAWSDYVLEEFDADEWEASEELVDHACDTVEAWLEHGLEWAGSRFNRRAPRPEADEDGGGPQGSDD